MNRPVVAGLLIGGLLGHVIAAQLNGGSRIAFLHHIGGFFLIAAITGLPIAGLTRWFWRSYANHAWLVFAFTQFVLGALVALGEWGKHH